MINRRCCYQAHRDDSTVVCVAESQFVVSAASGLRWYVCSPEHARSDFETVVKVESLAAWLASNGLDAS